MTASIRSSLLAALAGVVLLTGCKSGGSSSSTPPTSPTPPGPTTSVTVDIVGTAGPQAYQPNPVSAPGGYAVLFKNGDSRLHHIVLDDGADLGDLPPGTTTNAYMVQNTNPLGFHCKIHSSMVGNINAAAAPVPPPCTDPYGYGC